MIFTGRMLASADGTTVWEKLRGEGYALHFVKGGLVVDLSEAEFATLARLFPEALTTTQLPRIRRIILDGSRSSRRGSPTFSSASEIRSAEP
jgi:hypothetical protein